MAEVVFAIRASGGDYTTIAAWESDLDDDTPYDAGDDAIGELYAETYSENVVIDQGATLGLASITLRANASERHDGTPGTGPRILGSSTPVVEFSASGIPGFLEWIEVDRGGGSGTFGIVRRSGGGARLTVGNCLVHNYSSGSSANMGAINNGGGASNLLTVQNCVVFNCTATSASGAMSGILFLGAPTASVIFENNTITDINATNGAGGDAYGIQADSDDADIQWRNNLITDINSTAGSAACYSHSAPSNIVHQTNGSDDATSPDSSLRNLTITFEDAGNDDYRLASGDTDAIDVGTDLGAGDVAIDLLGRDRDAEGDTWDLGGFEFIAAGGGITHHPVAFLGIG